MQPIYRWFFTFTRASWRAVYQTSWKRNQGRPKWYLLHARFLYSQSYEQKKTVDNKRENEHSKTKQCKFARDEFPHKSAIKQDSSSGRQVRQWIEHTENTLDFIGASLVCRRNSQLMYVNGACVGADPQRGTMLLSWNTMPKLLHRCQRL